MFPLLRLKCRMMPDAIIHAVRSFWAKVAATLPFMRLLTSSQNRGDICASRILAETLPPIRIALARNCTLARYKSILIMLRTSRRSCPLSDHSTASFRQNFTDKSRKEAVEPGHIDRAQSVVSTLATRQCSKGPRKSFSSKGRFTSCSSFATMNYLYFQVTVCRAQTRRTGVLSTSARYSASPGY
jgi:hypothetical protein